MILPFSQVSHSTSKLGVSEEATIHSSSYLGRRDWTFERRREGHVIVGFCKSVNENSAGSIVSSQFSRCGLLGLVPLFLFVVVVLFADVRLLVVAEV